MRFLIQLAAFISISFSLSVSHAQEECSTVDYSKDLGPVRDQGETDWCYAYTAADMLTQKLRLSDPVKFKNEQISAVDVAFQYFRNPVEPPFTPNPNAIYTSTQLYEREKQKLRLTKSTIEKSSKFDAFNGGYTDLAIHAYTNEDVGICTEKDLPSTKGKTRDLVNAVDRNYQWALQQCVLKDRNKEMLTHFRNKAWEYAIEDKCKRQKIGIQKLIYTMDAIDGDPLPDGSFQFWAPDKSGQRVDATKEIRESLMKTMNEGLNRGRIVGVDLSPAFLMNPSAKKDLLKRHARHSLSVVSRQLKNGKCYYKLRNSWGKTCKMYSAKFKARCKGGQIEVTKEELIPNVFRTQYLE